MSLSIAGNWGRNIPMDDLHLLPEPESMGSRHFPITHVEGYQLTEKVLGINNLGMTNEVARVSDDNKRMMLSFDITVKGSKEVKYQTPTFKLFGIIINYQDQKGRFTYADGEHIFACTNEIVSAEYKISVKSMRNLRDNLRTLIWDRCEHFDNVFEKMTHRNYFMQGVNITGEEASHRIIEGARSGVINYREIRDIDEEWRNPTCEEFKPRTLYSLSNCFSRHFQDKNPFNVASRSTKLFDMMNNIIDEKREEEWELSSDTEIQMTEQEQKTEDEINGFSGP